MVNVCEKMGWDFFTYMAQPKWFVDLIAAKMGVEAKHFNQQIKLKRKR